MNKDLIEEDRDKEKKLRYELKERREKENVVFVIKRGKVIEVKDGLNRRGAYAREGAIPKNISRGGSHSDQGGASPDETRKGGFQA